MPCLCFFLSHCGVDDDLDQLRFDEADAKHILQLLAYRGDGDWQVQYQEHQIDVQDLRLARDNPSSNILLHKIEGFSTASAKGKGQAVDDEEHMGETIGSWRETNYDGVSTIVIIISAYD